MEWPSQSNFLDGTEDLFEDCRDLLSVRPFYLFLLIFVLVFVFTFTFVIFIGIFVVVLVVEIGSIACN